MRTHKKQAKQSENGATDAAAEAWDLSPALAYNDIITNGRGRNMAGRRRDRLRDMAAYLYMYLCAGFLCVCVVCGGMWLLCAFCVDRKKPSSVSRHFRGNTTVRTISTYVRTSDFTLLSLCLLLVHWMEQSWNDRIQSELSHFSDFRRSILS